MSCGIEYRVGIPKSFQAAKAASIECGSVEGRLVVKGLLSDYRAGTQGI
jgi:hypothetical protein